MRGVRECGVVCTLVVQQRSHAGTCLSGAHLRPEGPKFEAEGREQGQGKGSWEGAANLLPTSYGIWGSSVRSPAPPGGSGRSPDRKCVLDAWRPQKRVQWLQMSFNSCNNHVGTAKEIVLSRDTSHLKGCTPRPTPLVVKAQIEWEKVKLALSGLPVTRGLRPPKITELKLEQGPMWYWRNTFRPSMWSLPPFSVCW